MKWTEAHLQTCIWTTPSQGNVCKAFTYFLEDFEKLAFPIPTGPNPMSCTSTAFSVMHVTFGKFSSWFMFRVQSLLFCSLCVCEHKKKIEKVGKPKLWLVSQLLQLHHPILEPTLTLTALPSTSIWPSNTVVRPGTLPQHWVCIILLGKYEPDDMMNAVHKK